MIILMPYKCCPSCTRSIGGTYHWRLGKASNSIDLLLAKTQHNCYYVNISTYVCILFTLISPLKSVSYFW